MVCLAIEPKNTPWYLPNSKKKIKTSEINYPIFKP